MSYFLQTTSITRFFRDQGRSRIAGLHNQLFFKAAETQSWHMNLGSEQLELNDGCLARFVS